MILVHPDFEEPIVFAEGTANMLVVERQETFLKYVSGLNAQVNGDEGPFILSDSEKRIDLSKVAEMVINPLSMDINSRTSVSLLHKVLTSSASDENNYEKTNELLCTIEKAVNELAIDMDVEIENDEPNVSMLFKSLNVRFHQSDDVMERLCDFISIKSIYERKKVIIMVNACSFFGREQIQLILNHASNNKMYILLVEQHPSFRPIGVKIRTIDEDLCEY